MSFQKYLPWTVGQNFLILSLYDWDNVDDDNVCDDNDWCLWRWW